ncbi:MAG TPA: DUF4296 domain-containing protein [Parafilimonas sp.]|jgi:hypothetical protein
MLYVFVSCTSEDTKIPKDILPLNKMKLIVWDMTKAGEYGMYLQEKDTTKKKLTAVYLAEVLKLHNISKEDFFKSFKYYQAHPVLNQQLFDSVNAYAQKQRTELYKLRQ